MPKKILSGAEYDVLYGLFHNGHTWDGNIPSKTGRNSLIDSGWAIRINGWTSLTVRGFRAALSRGFDKKTGC